MPVPINPSAGPVGGILGAIPGVGFLKSLSGLGGLGAGFRSSSAASKSGGGFSQDRTFINVQPVGVNVGELFKNFEGPTSNGGYGFERKSLFPMDHGGQNSTPASFNLGVSGGANIGTTLLIVGVAGAIAFFVLKKKGKL